MNILQLTVYLFVVMMYHHQIQIAKRKLEVTRGVVINIIIIGKSHISIHMVPIIFHPINTNIHTHQKPNLKHKLKKIVNLEWIVNLEDHYYKNHLDQNHLNHLDQNQLMDHHLVNLVVHLVVLVHLVVKVHLVVLCHLVVLVHLVDLVHLVVLVHRVVNLVSFNGGKDTEN